MSVIVTLPDDTTKTIEGANSWRWETETNTNAKASGGFLGGGGSAVAVGLRQTAETHRVVTVGWKRYVHFDDLDPTLWSGYAKSVEFVRQEKDNEQERARTL